jgi:hypothetical protein
MGVDGKAPMASSTTAALHSNITISESYVLPASVVGTNDGNAGRDGGATRKNVVDNVPGVPKKRTSRVRPP